MTKRKDTYAADGVDVEEGDNFSSYAGTVCQSTYEHSPFVEVHDLSAGHFRGPRVFSFKNLPTPHYLDSSSDGIGTKVVLIDAASSHRYAARDLMAMTGGDITRYGGIPLVLVNILDVESVGEEGDPTNTQLRKLMTGLGEVAREQDIVVIKGETAELGACVGSENKDADTKFNWGSVMIGAYNPETIITGDTLKEGQVVISLREFGFRSNGISSVRKALQMKFGEEWWSNEDVQPYIKQAAAPSVLYDKFLSTLNGWSSDTFTPEVKVHAIAHITGGGIPSKFGDIIFSHALSADLDDLWDPPEIMKLCAEWRGVDDTEFYKTWNGGQGVLLVVDEADADRVVSRAKEFNIDAKRAGVLNKEKDVSIRITSRLNGEILEYKDQS